MSLSISIARLVVAAAIAGALSACGSYSGLPGSIGGQTGSGAQTAAVANCDELFAQRVQPRLEFCRNCHVPGGVADVEGGRKFQLSTNKAQDFQNLRASWLALEDGSPTSKILRKASGQEAHSGGAPWPQGSDAYRDVDAQLQGFTLPSACVLAGGGTVAELPLLGSSHAKTAWASFCEGKPDDASLPVDPRAMIRPGVNSGKAVYYNAWYEDCHAKLPVSEQAPKTCGVWRQRRDRGLLAFTDTLADGTLAAADYDNTWQKWGLSEKPANFEEMYTLRYGMNHAPFANPYPLSGEDPNATNGGSGHLPLGMRQLKDADGKWTSTIGTVACFSCHGGQVGDMYSGETEVIGLHNLGVGNNNGDTAAAASDDSVLGPLPLPVPVPSTALLFNLGVDQRGQNNAVGAFELLFMLLDYDSLGLNPNALKNAQNATPHPTAEAQDTPAWWNYGHRPRKFFDAGQSIDSTRIVMAAGAAGNSLISADGKSYRDQIEAHDQDLAAFFLSLQSPAYPGPIDSALAERGAILFHTKDLWAQDGNKDKPKPLGGNGSCAGCHGAYSPRYVNDSTYLESPALEGVAGHISPLDVIRTDRARADELTPYLRDAYSTTFWAYPDGQPGWTDPLTKNAVVELADDGLPPALRAQGACGWEREVIGYQAPPLYGTWATAPYLHNGSVPTIEQVLKSSDRAPIWRRQMQTIGPVTGYDQSLVRAYDFERLGWKHDVLACDQIPGNSLLNCNPVNPAQPSISELVQNFIRAEFNWGALVSIPDPSAGAAEKRFVYDTRKLGNSNAGHDFTDVLTDQERTAIIEYLKTL